MISARLSEVSDRKLRRDRADHTLWQRLQLKRFETEIGLANTVYPITESTPDGN